MAEYEVVREVQNLCGNNQMRDVFFEEIETDDPVGWVRGLIKGKQDRKSTRLNSSHRSLSRMPSSA